MDEVFAKKNIAYLDEALSEDFVEHQVMPGISPDKAGVRKIFEMMFQVTPQAVLRRSRSAWAPCYAERVRVSAWMWPMWPTT